MIFFKTSLAKGLTVGIVAVLLAPTALALRKYLRRNRGMAVIEAAGSEETVGTANQSERLFVATLFFVAAVTIAIQAPRYGLRESGLWPLFVALVMILAASVVLASEIRAGFLNRAKTRARPFTKGDLSDLFREWKPLLPTLAWVFLYIVLTILLGMHVSNLVGVFILLRLLGKMSLFKSGVWSVIVHVCIVLFFTVMFKILLWPGAFPVIIPNFIGGGSLRAFF